MATTTKGSYDPVKAIEGMFNGSVTRIAYALKDPSDYSVSTKTVLAECAKKFHDALDDCEIQILDAKWYLEGQLRTNRLRREAKAREMGTAAKRKHDQIQDTSEPNTTEEVAAKKAKVDGKSEQKESTDQAKPTEQPQSKPVSSNTKEPSRVTPTQQKSDKEEKAKESQLTTQNPQPSKPIPKPLPQSQPAAKSIEKSNPFETSKPLAQSNDQPSRQAQPAAPTADDFAKPTPQATPTGTNDDFFLESMFGEPMAEATGDGNKDGNDFEFDLTTGDLMGDAGDEGNQDPNSLDSFLPGLESYANQPDDNLLAMGLNTNNSTNSNNNTNNNNNNNNNNNPNPSNTQNTNILPTTSNDFDLPDLPDLGEPNVWDDLLNDDALNGGDMGVGNFDDNIDLTDSAFLDLDLDSFQ